MTGAYTESYTYNTIGNLLTKATGGTTRTYSYDDTQPHAVDSITNPSVSYTYDDNGNMNGGTARTWDEENRLASITKDGVTTDFVYDGDGNRVKKPVPYRDTGTEGGQTILYVNQYYEKVIAGTGVGTVTTYYYHGGRLVAKRAGINPTYTLSYIHQDHLSGTALATDTSGNQVGSTMKYKPFGETVSGSVPTDKLFTGQRLDGTGLYFYNARYYDPQIGRFISPDTETQLIGSHSATSLALNVSYSDSPSLYAWNSAQGDASLRRQAQFPSLDPQLLNRYTYARNNPLAYVDDSGHGLVFLGAILGAIIGAGAYTITHWGRLDWKGLLVWTQGGALIGSGLGWLAATFGPAIAASTSPWLLPVLQRGQQIEDMLGRNLTRNFPVIDKWVNGVATSIKSIDLTAKTYQNMDRLFQLIKGYVNELGAFKGIDWAGASIEANQITSRVLQLAIPPGATEEQIALLRQAIEWAKTQGVTITIDAYLVDSATGSALLYNLSSHVLSSKLKYDNYRREHYGKFTY